MSGRDNNEPVDTPLDLAAVQADDALLDMLSSAGPAPGDADAELARVLLAWRANVETEPIPELVSTDAALTVIAGARRRPAARRHPVLGPVAAAAAVLVITFFGVSLGAKSAEPGDQLWPLTKVLYSDYARSVQAAVDVQDKLDKARSALQQRRPEQARELLDSAQQQLGAVDDSEREAELTDQRNQLEEMLDGTVGPTSEPTPTTTPDPQTSSSPVSVLPAPTSESTATSTPAQTAEPTTTPSAPSSESSTSITPFSAPSEPPGTSEPTVAAPPEGSAAGTGSPSG